jgi:hypothetical protein
MPKAACTEEIYFETVTLVSWHLNFKHTPYPQILVQPSCLCY